MANRRSVELSEIEMQIIVRALACLSLFKGDRFRLEGIAGEFEGGIIGIMRQRRNLLRELLPGFAGQLDASLDELDIRDHVDALRGIPDEERGGIVLPVPVIVGDPLEPITLEIRWRDKSYQLGPVSDMLIRRVGESVLELVHAIPDIAVDAIDLLAYAQLWLCMPKHSKAYKLGYLVDAIVDADDSYSLRVVGFMDFAALGVRNSVTCVP